MSQVTWNFDGVDYVEGQKYGKLEIVLVETSAPLDPMTFIFHFRLTVDDVEYEHVVELDWLTRHRVIVGLLGWQGRQWSTVSVLYAADPTHNPGITPAGWLYNQLVMIPV